jgi:haloalkane dehalogenase
LRVHYLDEGRHDHPVVVMLHGEPSWCFLYRNMIPPLVATGHRCIVPDLIGFGRSDKPVQRSDYTYARHVRWMEALLVDHLDLEGVTFFGQDWGGLIGLRVITDHAARFARIVLANTGLPTGDRPISDAFLRWQRFSQEAEQFDVGRIVNGGSGGTLTSEVIDAYDAPFPTDEYKSGARVFPTLVPTRPDDPAAEANRRAWESLEKWDKPLLTAFSDGDPVTAGGETIFQPLVPGAAGQPHVTIHGAGHFLQEQQGPRLAQVIAELVARTS